MARFRKVGLSSRGCFTSATGQLNRTGLHVPGTVVSAVSSVGMTRIVLNISGFKARIGTLFVVIFETLRSVITASGSRK